MPVQNYVIFRQSRLGSLSCRALIAYQVNKFIVTKCRANFLQQRMRRKPHMSPVTMVMLIMFLVMTEEYLMLTVSLRLKKNGLKKNFLMKLNAQQINGHWPFSFICFTLLVWFHILYTSICGQVSIKTAKEFYIKIGRIINAPNGKTCNKSQRVYGNANFHLVYVSLSSTYKHATSN